MVYHFWQEKLMLAVGRQSETIIIVKRNLLSIWLFFLQVFLAFCDSSL